MSDLCRSLRKPWLSTVPTLATEVPSANGWEAMLAGQVPELQPHISGLLNTSSFLTHTALPGILSHILVLQQGTGYCDPAQFDSHTTVKSLGLHTPAPSRKHFKPQPLGHFYPPQNQQRQDLGRCQNKDFRRRHSHHSSSGPTQNF